MLEFTIAMILSVLAPAAIGLAFLTRGGKGGTAAAGERLAGDGSSAFIKGIALRNMRARIALDEAVESHRAPIRSLAVALAVGLLLAGGVADAKPKLGVQCSIAQTVKASKCIKKQENDIMNNVPNPHFVACLADGTIACCQASTTGPGNNCTYVRVDASSGVTSPMGGGVMQKTTP